MKIKQIWLIDCPFNETGQGGILFDDGTGLVDIHYQDCCEYVYADFGNIDTEALTHDFTNITIHPYRYGFTFGDNRQYFVPCYNEQNGYYSDRLSIVYGKVAKKLVGYKKGKAVYDDVFIPITQIKECRVKDEIS